MTAIIRLLDQWSLAKRAAALLSANFLLIAFAQLKLNLWFTPVPITGQTFAVAVTAGLLGKRYGLLVVLLYLIEGCCGLPVFAGQNGFVALAGPTGGYLIGFALGAYLIGYIIDKAPFNKGLAVFSALIVGHAAFYLCGLSWLALYVGWDKTVPLGLAPFIVGDLLKLLAAAVVIIPAVKQNRFA